MNETFEFDNKGREKMMETTVKNVLKSFGTRVLTTLTAAAVLFVTGWSFHLLFNY